MRTTHTTKLLDRPLEPDLGSLDGMTDQRKSWRQHNGPGVGWLTDNGDQEVDTTASRPPTTRKAKANPNGAGPADGPSHASHRGMLARHHTVGKT